MLNAPPHHLSWWNEAAFNALANKPQSGDCGVEAVPFSFDSIIYWMGRFSPKLTGDRYFLSALDLVLRARLELVGRPCLRRAVPGSGIGRTFELTAHRPQAVVTVWLAAAVAVFYALWSVALALLFLHKLRVQYEQSPSSATLVLPATGTLPGLEDLLAALAAQSLAPRRLIVSVEFREDPAYARIALFAESNPPLKSIWSSPASRPLRSQKCTNLLAALAQLNDDDDYVVLLDADIRPQPWWLASLVAPLAAGRADLVNGYRWPVPARLSLGTALVAAIDRAIAVLPRLSSTRPIWGGSLAVTRSALEMLDLPATIGRTLTEDLPIGDRAAQAGLRVLTRRASGRRPRWRELAEPLALRPPSISADPPLSPRPLVVRRVCRQHRLALPRLLLVFVYSASGDPRRPSLSSWRAWARSRPR